MTDTKEDTKAPQSVDYEQLARDVAKLGKKEPPRSISPSPESSAAGRIQIGGVDVRFKDNSLFSKFLPYIVMTVFGTAGSIGVTKVAQPEIPPAVLEAPGHIENIRTSIKQIEQRVNTLEQDTDEMKRREIPRLKRDVESLIQDYEAVRKSIPSIKGQVR